MAALVASSLCIPLNTRDVPAQARAAVRRPNILVIVTDDQRPDTLRYMPHTRRWFRRGGTTFENAYATTPVCCPSRASILTGRYAHNHGVKTQANEGRAAAERSERMMIQRRLRKAGYRTALYGKYLNNWALRRSPTGLDKWSIFAHSAPDGYRGGIWNVNGTLRQIDRYSTDYLARRAVGFVKAQERNDDTPWFLYVAPAAPHGPFVAERRYRDARVQRWRGNPAVNEADRTDKPSWVQLRDNPPRRGRRIRTKQIRTLMSVDDLVGRVSRTLNRLDESRNTLAIYTSDNGLLWGEHGLGTKRWPYLRSPGVPLMIRWPERVEDGIRDERLAANIDIAPTIADAAGITPAGADGRSLLAPTRRTRLLLEYFFNERINPPEWASTLTSAFQYIEYYDPAGVLIGREYYDLVADPWQLTNVLGDVDPTNDPPPLELTELALQLRADRECRGSECP